MSLCAKPNHVRTRQVYAVQNVEILPHQTTEIAVRHAAATHPGDDWTAMLPAIQAALNSSVSAIMGHTPHKLLYGFELRQPWSLLRQVTSQDISAKADAEHSTAWAAMRIKQHYDSRIGPRCHRNAPRELLPFFLYFRSK
ncbi:uncharacterized protein N7515_008087 [Penicillium bovifimosum]|uniref:Uncharacterized protein n=1 Tax=Penicillium bovifimosum TaxID=126998 RepID=A0A9W9GNH7_9EURO|nr:uncharacterized protein N7515_008087 [Penicillium bovifimosum]KAJ5124262.1 hypothetical protein N7515_008087 [Penicillium bovifimosum]